MQWNEDVQRLFSGDAAKRWNDMYLVETERAADSHFRERRDYAVAWAAERLSPDARILDLGCGSGPLLCELRALGYDCVGVDYSLEMLAYARRRLATAGAGETMLLHADSQHLPFPDATFDAVACLGVISYVEHYEHVLAEIARILKPGGQLIVSCRNFYNAYFFDPVALLSALLKKLRGAPVEGLPTAGRRLKPRVVESRLSDAGFEIVAFKGMGFGPPRIAGRPLLKGRAASAFDHTLARAAARFRRLVPPRWLADVTIWSAATRRDGPAAQAQPTVPAAPRESTPRSA